MLILSQTHTFLVLPMIKIKCLQTKDKTRAVLSTEHTAVIHHCMSLMGHCHLSPCLLPGGKMWSHWLRSNTAFEIRVSLSLFLPQKTSGKMENSPAEFGGCETNTEIFLSVGFLACFSYLRTGWDISLIITRLGFSPWEMLTFAGLLLWFGILRPKTWFVLLITLGNLCLI